MNSSATSSTSAPWAILLISSVMPSRVSPGIVLLSTIISQRSGTMGPPPGVHLISVTVMVPLPRNGCESNSSFAPLIASTIGVILYRAFSPNSGMLAWLVAPLVVTLKTALPRCPMLRAMSVGSPRTHAVGLSPSSSMIFLVETPSLVSSWTTHVSTSSPFSSGAAQPWIMAASAPFMSTVPLPYMMPSTISAEKGGRAQFSGSPGPTLSMWASKRMDLPPFSPRLPTTLPISSLSTR